MPLTIEEKKAKQKIRSARWYERNKELASQRAKEAYASDPISHQKRMREYHFRTRDERLKQAAEYRRLNHDVIRAADKEWRLKNKSKKAASDKEYRVKNIDHVREVQRVWKQKNKHRVRLSNLKRKALKKKASVNLDGMKQWMASILSKPFSTCYYCERKISTSGIHFDHIIPIIEGGQHCVDNLCVSCPSCNLAKGRKPITVWVKPGQQILAL